MGKKAVAALVLGALLLGAGSFLSTKAGQRFLVQRGVPIPGWCSLTTSNYQLFLPQEDMATLATRIVDKPKSVTNQQREAMQTPLALDCITRSERNLVSEVASSKTGLTPRAQTLKAGVATVFGKIPNGGYDPNGISSGRVAGSAHYDGRAIDYFFRPYDSTAKQIEGWTFANWLVANSAAFDISVVIYSDHIWTVRRSAQGWREYTHPSGDTTNPVLRHLDHVHVDVQRGY